MTMTRVTPFFERHLFIAGRLAMVAGALIVILVFAIGAPSARAGLTLTEFMGSTESNVAGAHSDATGAFSFQTTLDSSLGTIDSGGVPRNGTITLPSGLVALAQNVPQCPVTTFTAINLTSDPGCPPDTQIGAGTLTLNFDPTPGSVPLKVPAQIYNLATSLGQSVVAGVQADVGNILGQQLVAVTAHAADDYAITLSFPEIPRPQAALLLGAHLTLWDVPAASSHNSVRACEQDKQAIPGGEIAHCASTAPPLPFVENPTECSTAPITTFSVDTYEEPEVFTEAAFAAPIPTNCETVPFAPSLSLTPESNQAGAPTGLQVDLGVPQSQDLYGQGVSELKTAVVTLPPGMVISPSAASNGLEGCSDAQFGLGSDAPATCPQSSQIGTTEIVTQLLSGPLTGKMYLGQPLSNDPSSGQMFRIFMELRGFGQDIKLAGAVTANEATGQLTATFANLPEVPFEEAKIKFNAGPNAPLVNPADCGSHTATTDLYPYSEPATPATPVATSTTSYDGNGAPCPSPLPFSPSASISTAASQAGALSPVSVSFSRGDGTQPLGQLSAHLPPGLLGYVSKVPLCDPADAAAGTCPSDSRIGEVSATVGAGPDPLTVPGSVYLAQGTGSYPFALSVVVPAAAGPYSLENVTVLVNLKVNDDGSLTAVSNPLPSIIDGIPLDVRGFTLTIDRPGFTINPTNCSPLAMTGSATSLSGTVAAISAPFQVSGCGSLPFRPSFTVATQGSTSKADGAALSVRVAQQLGEANIHSVKVELPKVLPSRLTTLQKACPEGVFFANPARCDPQSVVGTAVVSTPVLGAKLSGPAYFISHGGAKFPELIIVLQGEGITIKLAGETFISKAGVTSSTFSAVPDVPINAFELSLPEGPYSALAVNASLCTSKLLMPTTITGQSGVVVKQSTRIAVSGCEKPKVKVTKTGVKGSNLLVTLKTSSTGTVKLSGVGVVARTKKLGLGSHQLELALTGTGRSLAAHHQKLKLQARLTVEKQIVTETTSVRL